MPQKRILIDKNYPEVSISKQCELLGLARSSFYYQPCGESQENLSLMKEMDKIYTAHPEYGARKIRLDLHDLPLYAEKTFNLKRIRRRTQMHSLWQVR